MKISYIQTTYFYHNLSLLPHIQPPLHLPLLPTQLSPNFLGFFSLFFPQRYFSSHKIS